MSIQEPKYNARLGDVDHAFGFKAGPFPKKTGDAGSGDHLLLKGRILAKDTDDTTQVAFTTAKAGSVKPFLVARGNITISPPFESTGYIVTDSQGNLRDENGLYISALETDETVSGVYEGYAVVEFDEEVQVGDPVMPAADGSGKAINWDGSDPEERVGYYRGRPGFTTGEFPPGKVVQGQLGWISVNR